MDNGISVEELFCLPTTSDVPLLRGTEQDSRPSETVGSVKDALEKPSVTNRASNHSRASCGSRRLPWCFHCFDTRARLATVLELAGRLTESSGALPRVVLSGFLTA